MNQQEREELVSEIEEALDNLDYDLVYELNDYHSNDVSIVEIDIDINYVDDYADDWDEQLEDIISNIISEWDDESWYSWEDSILSVSIPD